MFRRQYCKDQNSERFSFVKNIGAENSGQVIGILS